MEIRIESYLSGSHLLECEPEKWDAIVILDSDIPEPEFVAEMTRSHLFLNFDDIESPAWGKRVVSSQMVKSALRFAKKSQHLLVCCRAGQSRSSALAYTIAFENGGAELALNRSLKKRNRFATTRVSFSIIGNGKMKKRGVRSLLTYMKLKTRRNC